MRTLHYIASRGCIAIAALLAFQVHAADPIRIGVAVGLIFEGRCWSVL